MSCCRIYVLISCLLISSLALGCISRERSMNVSVDLLEKSIETEAVEGGLKVMVNMVARAKNKGDPGYIDIVFQVFDDIDAKFIEYKERIHMDEGESREITKDLQKVAPADADIESFHISAYATNPSPD